MSALLLSLMNGARKTADGLSLEARKTLIAAFSFLMFAISTLSPILSLGYPFVMASGVGLTLAVVWAAPPRSESSVLRFRVGVLLLVEVVGVSFLVNSAVYGVFGYFAIGVVLSLLVPCYHWGAASSEPSLVFSSMSRGIVVFFWVFMLFSVLCGPPYDGGQYASFLGNPNQLGNLLIVVVSASLCVLWEARSRGDRCSVCLGLLTAALAFSVCYISGSRTACLSAIVQILFMLLLDLCVFSGGTFKGFLFRFAKVLAISLGSFALCFALLTVSLTSVKGAVAEFLPGLQMGGYAHVDVTSASESISSTSRRLSKGLADNENDALTSGRLGIWKDFAGHISLLGHESETRSLVSGDRSYESAYAHNVYLQVAYSAGALAGLAMVALVFVSFVRFAQMVHSAICDKRMSSCQVLYGASLLSFTVFSLVSDGYMLYGYMPATLFWLLLCLVSVKAT